jgi:spore maturation protein CgeB
MNPCYTYRRFASRLLKEKNLIEIYDKRVMNKAYIKALQLYVSHLNCSSVFNIETAKMFEIMSAGSVLFTDESERHKVSELFDKDSYITYKRDYSDLIEKAEKIIKDKDFRKAITEKGMKCISRKHTHEIRAKELIKLIGEIYGIR